MPRGRKQTRPVVEPIRRKCAACGKIKLVVFRKWTMPPSKFVANQNNRPNRGDVDGAQVENYCCFQTDSGEMECMVNA
tara:strand:- start:1232 stop:1465 length:234 start_codon:yes stop_codon:yes gene_type:complete